MAAVLRLLKLHGSINWRPKLGYANPVAIDIITTGPASVSAIRRSAVTWSLSR